MKNNFHSQVIKLCLYEILIQSGFERTTTTSLTTLSDLLAHYIRHITKYSFNRRFINKRVLFDKLSARERGEVGSYLHAQKKICEKQSSLNLLEQLRIMPDEKDEVVEECVEESRVVKKTRDENGVDETLCMFIERCRERLREMEKSGRGKINESVEKSRGSGKDGIKSNNETRNDNCMTGNKEAGSNNDMTNNKEDEIKDKSKGVGGEETTKEMNDFISRCGDISDISSIPPFFIKKRCMNRIKRDAKEYAEMLEWRKERKENGMITEELLCVERRVVEKE